MIEAAVRPVAVVVSNKLLHDFLQMPFVEDEHVIQALPAQRAHEPLGNAIRLRELKELRTKGVGVI